MRAVFELKMVPLKTESVLTSMSYVSPGGIVPVHDAVKSVAAEPVNCILVGGFTVNVSVLPKFKNEDPLPA